MIMGPGVIGSFRASSTAVAPLTSFLREKYYLRIAPVKLPAGIWQK